jgi:CRP-like cAMP-binding protein
MFLRLMNELQCDPDTWKQCQRWFRALEVPAKATLLREGEVAETMYIVKSGCLRLWFNNDGKDVTFQFFFENQPVSSLESFLSGEPSLFSLESLDPTRMVAIGRRDWDTLCEQIPRVRELFTGFLVKRLTDYGHLFLSRIKDPPERRYETLLREHPEIVQRVPQHYIASYLGITPVSLSRIRGRRARKGRVS